MADFGQEKKKKKKKLNKRQKFSCGLTFCENVHLLWLGTKAHFTQGGEPKVEPKSGNPIGAAAEISPQDLTLVVKAKLDYT